MKRWAALFLSVLLALLLVPAGLNASAAAAGTLTVGAAAQSVTVGNTVKVTVTYSGGANEIASIWSNISYNTNAFSYVSDAFSGTNGSSVHGEAGNLKVLYSMPATGVLSKTVTLNLTFKAVAPGSLNLSVQTLEFTANDNSYSTLGTPSKTLAVSAINPTKSANANLASLKPSSGTLTPKFSANVTDYTISVPYTTTSLSLSATTQDKDAKIAVSGKNALAVGKNTQVITVTAPNGTTKKYTVVINRSANQTTTASGSGTGTTTTTTPQEDPLEVEVDGKTFVVSDTQPDTVLPDGHAWTHITINDVTVSAAVNSTTNITLVYLVNTEVSAGSFYIYDDSTRTFSAFCPFVVNGGNYILREMPAGLVPPKGTVEDVHTFGSVEREVYRFEDAALSDILLVYATSPAGKTGLYTYDATDGSMQLYREITVAADVAPQTTQSAQSNGVGGFVAQHRQVILIGAAAAGGLALLIAAIVLLILTTRKDKHCKH